MGTKHTFRILFWLNKSKDKNNRLPIYARVTVNGLRAEISLARYCNPESWDERAHRMKGRSSEATILNKYLDSKFARLLQCYEDLLKEDGVITAKAVKVRFLGSDSTFRKTVENQRGNKSITSRSVLSSCLFPSFEPETIVDTFSLHPNILAISSS